MSVIKPGRILLEVAAARSREGRLRAALQFALRKLPVRGHVVERRILLLTIRLSRATAKRVFVNGKRSAFQAEPVGSSPTPRTLKLNHEV